MEEKTALHKIFTCIHAVVQNTTLLWLNISDAIFCTAFCQALPMAAAITNRAAELYTVLVEV